MHNPAAGTLTVNFMKKTIDFLRKSVSHPQGSPCGELFKGRSPLKPILKIRFATSLIPASLILFLLLPAVSNADTAPDIQVGKIEFISSAQCEVIVYASTDSGLAAASNGSILYTITGKNRITLTVKETGGRFIRCTFKCSNTEKPVLTVGAMVFFAASDNAAVPYADVKVMMHRLLKIYRDFVLAVESTDDPETIASAINQLSLSLEILIPEINRLNARYPELDNFMTSPPEELKEDVALLNRTGQLVSDAFLKAAKMQPNRSIDEALKRLKVVMDKMESSGK